MNRQRQHFNILNERLNEIQNFITLIDLQKKLFVEYNKTDDKSNIPLLHIEDYCKLSETLGNSRVQYNAAIISIYACFENYIDDLAKSYVEFYLFNIMNFEELPLKTKETYLRNAGEFLTNPHRYSGIELTSSDIIKRLSDNISDIHETPLQYEFVLKHSGNLKIDNLAELFKNIGIDSLISKLKCNYIFMRYTSEIKNISLDCISETLSLSNDIFNNLDKLVNARNNVAHGWIDYERISYKSLIYDMIPFIRVLCNALLEITLASSFYLLQTKGKLVEYDAPIAVYNKNILCINTKSSKLRAYDYIFYIDTSSQKHITQINELQIDGKPQSEIVVPNVKVGINLDRPIKDTYKFYYINTMN